MPKRRGERQAPTLKSPERVARIAVAWREPPVFVSAPLKDEVMEVAGVKSAIASASAVYEFRKAGGSLQATHPEGGRDFPAVAREEAYVWLEKRLKR